MTTSSLLPTGAAQPATTLHNQPSPDYALHLQQARDTLRAAVA